MSEPRLVVEGVSLHMGSFALREISFTVAASEVFVILGSSGAGKSVLLETLAGFNRPERGRVCIDGQDVTMAPPEERRIGFMFQDYALFPHLTVAQNVAFARRFAAGAGPRESIDALLERLEIQHLAAREPARLSGGERQRVALARALATDPRLFLLDEPLAALDARNRDKLRGELKHFLRSAAIPAVYVTHDQVEALALADKMAVMEDGMFAQVGTPSEIFNTPANAAVASFVGVETVLEGTVVSVDEGIAGIAVNGCILYAASTVVAVPNARLLACIRPEDVALARTRHGDSSVRNQLESRVVATQAAGPLFKVTLDCGFPLHAYVSKLSYLELGLATAATVVAGVKATAVHLIPR